MSLCFVSLNCKNLNLRPAFKQGIISDSNLLVGLAYYFYIFGYLIIDLRRAIDKQTKLKSK